jgi:O-antigen/teichoic acid export membrane protein
MNKKLLNIKFNNFKKNKLFKNTIIYTTTEIINKAVPFLLLPILTIYLSPSDYGTVATYGAFSLIVAVLIHLSMTGAISVNFFKLSKGHLKIYIFNTLIIAFTSMSILSIFMFFFSDEISSKLNIPSIWLFIGIFVTFSQFITSLNLTLWQMEQEAAKFGIYQVIQTLTNAISILVFVIVYKMGWEGQLIGQAIAAILFSTISFRFIYNRGYLDFKINNIYIKDTLKFGVPLIPHALSGWFRTGADRILISSMIGTAATGIYAIGYQIGLIVGIIAIAFNKAFYPYLYKKLENILECEKIKIVKFTYMYFIVILVIATLVSLIMPWFITNFLDERYLEARQYVAWISFGQAFQGMYFMVVNYIFYVKKTYTLSLITFSSGLFHVLLSYIFIKINGPIGAAQATTLSFFLMFILAWIYSSKVYSMPWRLDEKI